MLSYFFRARRACNVQLELSNDCLPETEYQGVLAHPHTAVLDSGAIGHTTLLPYTSDVSNTEFIQSGDWFQLPYGTCHGTAVGLRGSPPPTPQRLTGSCARSRPPAVTVCSVEAHPMSTCSPPPPASPGLGAASTAAAAAVVTSTIKTGRYARQNSLTSSFSNLI